jgi:hypothetical protein
MIRRPTAQKCSGSAVENIDNIRAGVETRVAASEIGECEVGQCCGCKVCARSREQSGCEFLDECVVYIDDFAGTAEGGVGGTAGEDDEVLMRDEGKWGGGWGGGGVLYLQRKGGGN